MSSSPDAPDTDDVPGSAPDGPPHNEPTSHYRRVRALRALRLGSLLAVPAAYGLARLWDGGIPIGESVTDPITTAVRAAVVAWLIGLILWWRPVIEDPVKDRGSVPFFRVFFMLLALGVVAFAARSAGQVVMTWWRTYTVSGINVGQLLAAGMGIVGMGLFVSTDLWLRCLYRIRPDLVPPSALGHRLLPHLRGPLHGTHGTTRLALAAVTTLPILLLGLAAVVAQVATASPYRVTTVTAAPASPPTAPDTLAVEAAWSLDVVGLREVEAGAAGPLILSRDGLIALDPSDGSTLWRLEREVNPVGRQQDTSGGFTGTGATLITSPNGRYAALMVNGPGEVLQDAPENVLLTIDTLTGEITGEHLLKKVRQFSDVGVQLTDSAVLCGNTAYSLADGTELWRLDGASMIRYTGSAGHSSFILAYNSENGDGWLWGRSAELTVIPDSDPRATTQVNGVMMAPDGRLVIVDGWVGRYRDGVPTDTDGSDTTGWPTTAVNLDALAGVPGAPAETVDLGHSVGLNVAASAASGNLVVLPGSIPPEQQGEDPDFMLREDVPTVGAVFDPDTLTVTAADRTPGLAAARMGLALADGGEEVETNLVIQPADGAAATTLPIEPGLLLESPGDTELPLSLYELAVADADDAAFNAWTTPGVTVVSLDTSSSAYRVGPHLYRLYGVTGA